MIEPSFVIRTKNRECPVFVGPGMLSQIRLLMTDEPKRIVIVTDDVVAKLYLEQVSVSLHSSSAEVLIKILPSGEMTKSLEFVSYLYNFLAENCISRSDYIIALGGGVIGDIAGFVASTFKRGMKLVQVPTTLLAQVDSSLGGKTAVNLKWGKNLVGSFYHPHAILVDISVLESLPENQFKAGLAEVIKYGVIMDSGLLELLAERKDQIIQRDPQILKSIVERCLEHKANIVEQDEEEEGIRKILNFGHTVGHAIEVCSEHTFSHGEAVSVGMVEEARYAVKLGQLNPESLAALQNSLQNFGLPISLPDRLSVKEIKEVMKQDKKIRHGRIILPVLVGLGRTELRAVDSILI